ncbi:substrate-specific component FolT of folate ECF transporter [Lachnospiraceae bacterium KM106-2]|nr:substrate-specific component FolT of folate ECF transporter [Lachnospiraceae bacterium KM106-2]
MKNLFSSTKKSSLGIFKESFLELQHVTTLVLTAFFIGLAIVIGFYTIQIGEIIKIGFSFIAVALTGFMFGPVVGGLMGGLTDIISFVIKPTGPFFPGFTLTSILSGMVYGIFLYKKPISLLRVFLAKFTVSLFLNLFLSTFWLNMLYGKAFIPLLATRCIKQAVMLPIEVALLYVVMKSLEKANVFSLVQKKDQTN